MAHSEPDLLEGGGEPLRARLVGPRLVGALVLLLVAGVAVTSVAAVHYKRASDRGPITPRPTPVASSQAVPRAPIVSRHTYRLLGGKLTVRLMAIAIPNAHRDQLVISGQVVGGIPNHRYVLAGRSCPGEDDEVSAQGVTNASGNGLLTGRVWNVIPGLEYLFSLHEFACERWQIRVQMPPT